MWPRRGGGCNDGGRGVAAVAVGEEPAARAGVVAKGHTLDEGIASPPVRLAATPRIAAVPPAGMGIAAGGNAASAAAVASGSYGTTAAADGA